jgi:general secretion pathway protein I
MVAERRSAAGLTLLEVVVALTIAGLALVGMFEAGGTGLFAADTAARAEEAVERVQSHLAAVGRNAALSTGQFTDDDGGGFRWRLDVTPAATRQVPGPDGVSMSNITLFAVTVEVSWRDRGRERRVVLKTMRLGSATAGG